jgi:hypothetical protein
MRGTDELRRTLIRTPTKVLIPSMLVQTPEQIRGRHKTTFGVGLFEESMTRFPGVLPVVFVGFGTALAT